MKSIEDGGLVGRPGTAAFHADVFRYCTDFGRAATLPGDSDGEASGRIERRAFETGVELFHRSSFTRAAAGRAAGTLYGGSDKELTRSKRKEIREANTAAILAGDTDAVVEAELDIQRMSGDEVFIFLFLIDRAERNPVITGNTATVYTSFNELALLVRGRADSKTRPLVGRILKRLGKMETFIRRRSGSIGMGHAIDWFFVKEIGDGRRVGVEVHMHKGLLAGMRKQKQYYSISLIFMYLMNGADIAVYSGDGLLGHMPVYDKLTPTARGFARKLYILSKVVGQGGISGTVPEIITGYLEYSEVPTRAVRDAAEAAIQWLAVRAIIRLERAPAERGKGQARRWKIAGGVINTERPDVRDFVKSMRAEMSALGVRMVDTFSAGDTAGRGVVIARKGAGKAVQPALPGVIPGTARRPYLA